MNNWWPDPEKAREWFNKRSSNPEKAYQDYLTQYNQEQNRTIATQPTPTVPAPGQTTPGITGMTIPGVAPGWGAPGALAPKPGELVKTGSGYGISKAGGGFDPWSGTGSDWEKYYKSPAWNNLYGTQATPGGLLNTGPLNNYTQPFKMPQIGGGGNQAMKNLAGASMDLWDFKRPDYGGTSVTGAANWSDLLNFGG